MYQPPAIYNFPPFYTLQPNSQTKSVQIENWCSIVLNWAESESVWSTKLDGTPYTLQSSQDSYELEEDENMDASNRSIETIFENRQLPRKVSSELNREIWRALISSSPDCVIPFTNDGSDPKTIHDRYLKQISKYKLQNTKSKQQQQQQQQQIFAPESKFLLFPKSIDIYASLLLQSWDDSGVKGSVLTLYEITEYYKELPINHLSIIVLEVERTGACTVIWEEGRIVGVKVA
ncbi:ESCRT-II subunit protein [Martiniozyma asiatica (nom. inval.)]|nr:ESCRT-II subunit protein [Martiniozyma asiatica]